ncbi:hypothetical protein ACOME3_006697 [Neoechinorhynchus agilis]
METRLKFLLLLIISECGNFVVRHHTDASSTRNLILTFKEGDVGNLTCPVAPFTPIDLVDWHFNDRQISQGNIVLSRRHRVDQLTIETISLLIYPLQINDSGRYLCIEQEFGEIDAFDLYVTKFWQCSLASWNTEDLFLLVVISLIDCL